MVTCAWKFIVLHLSRKTPLCFLRCPPSLLFLSHILSSPRTNLLQTSRMLPPKRSDDVWSRPPPFKSVSRLLTMKSNFYSKSLFCKKASPVPWVYRWTQNRSRSVSIAPFPCSNSMKMAQKLRFINSLMSSWRLLLIHRSMLNWFLAAINLPDHITPNYVGKVFPPPRMKRFFV